MNEFGGWSKREPPEQKPEAAPVPEVVPEPEPVPEPEQEAVQEEAPAPEERAEEKPSKFQFIHMENPPEPQPEENVEQPKKEAQPDAQRPQREKQPEEVWVYHPEEEIAPPLPPTPKKRPPREKVVRPRKPKPARPPVREVEYPGVEEAYKIAGKKKRSLLLRRRLVGVLCLLALALNVCGHMGISFGNVVPEGKLLAQISLALLILACLAANDVLISGVYQILQLRPNLDSVLLVQAIVFTVEGFHSLQSGKMPYTAVFLLGLFFSMWGRVAENRARRNSLKAVLTMGETPSAAVHAKRAWSNRDCVLRADGDESQYTRTLETPSAVDTAMRLYAPLLICLSLVMAAVVSVLREADFLASWAAMLAGGLPVSMFIAYWKPFASVSARLLSSGAALCGWDGAKKLAGEGCIAVEDTDLFAKSNVTMNGMKVFGDYNVSQVVGYTYAVIAESGCGLEAAFHEVFTNQNGRAYRIDNFRRYEGGGIGAEIQGEVILIGSIAFMQLMGVKMPEGTNVRQAVYCAVNGELGAVFAINYIPSAAVKSGLQLVQSSKNLTILLATRDFILTPAAVRHKFKIQSDKMEYPSVEERVRLSDAYAAAGGTQTALLARESFFSMAEAAVSGRRLYSSTRSGLVLNLFGGILGFGIALALSWLNAFDAASAFNLMLFWLLWSIPALLVTALSRN